MFFNVVGFFHLYISKNYKLDAFKIEVNLGTYMTEKKRYDNIDFLWPHANFDFLKFYIKVEWKL